MALSGCLAAIEKPFQIPPVYEAGYPSIGRFSFFSRFQPKNRMSSPEIT